MPGPHGENTKDGYPNQIMKLLFERASCRNFSDRKIPPDVLQLVLKAGTHGPTGGNLQPYSIIKIEDDETKQRLTELGMQSFITKAPCVLLFCIDWHRIERWASLEVAPFTAASSFPHFWISFIDTVICAQNICTAADSMGLGSVYLGSVIFSLTDIRDMFKLPKRVFPVILVCIGYPKVKPQPKSKLGIDVTVHSEKYNEMQDEELKNAFSKKYHNYREKFEITKERLEKIFQVCREVHGEKFAKRCVDRVKENGFINTAQYYFCLHYQANLMPTENDMFVRIMEEFGFDWFKKYRPFKNKTT